MVLALGVPSLSLSMMTDSNSTTPRLCVRAERHVRVRARRAYAVPVRRVQPRHRAERRARVRAARARDLARRLACREEEAFSRQDEDDGAGHPPFATTSIRRRATTIRHGGDSPSSASRSRQNLI
jgi:hypothetical protein